MSRSSRLTVLAVAALLVVLLLPAGSAQAQTGEPIQIDGSVGFDGYIQSGTWTPITVTVSNDGADVTGELRVTVDPFTGASADYLRPIDLPRGSRKQVTFYAADVTAFGGAMQIDLLDERGRVLHSEAVRVQTVTPTTLLIGVWSGAPQGLADIGLVEPSSGETRVATLSVQDLPPDAKGWAALDVLAVSDVDTGQMTAEQQDALRGWLAGGGRLLIVGGVGYQRTLSGLAEISPVRAQGTENMRLDALAQPLQVDASLAGEAPVAVGPLADDARVLVAQDGVPLIAWRQVGYGRVDFFAPDPNLAPLVGWDGLEVLWRSILADGEPRPSWGYGFSSQWDYARQAVAAVPGITLPSVLQLCGFLALYVVLIGPVNYLVLTRLNRRELAWFTIPALILLFSGAAYITGFQLRGSQAILHRLAVVQSWQGDDIAEVDGLLGVWSPRRARYDIELEDGLLARPLPRSLGGALTSGGESTVEQLDQVTLQGVSVDIGSVTPFVLEGFTQAAPDITADLTLQPESDGVHVVGRIHNAGYVTLKDATLVLGGTVVPLGELAPESSVDVDEVLVGGRAARAAGSPLDPYPLDSVGYYGGPYDTFISEVSGGECFGPQDVQRRCNLLMSVLNGQVHGADITLFGWSDAVPFTTDVLNGGSDNVDLALYIVQLDAALSHDAEGELIVPPGLMQWTRLDQDSYGYANPYDLYMYPGQRYTFRYEPSQLVPPLEVDAFTIHLEQQYANDEAPLVQILNLMSGRWDSLNMDFGTLTINETTRYVDAAGGVELRLVGVEESFGSQISRFDVTLHGTVASEDGE